MPKVAATVLRRVRAGEQRRDRRRRAACSRSRAAPRRCSDRRSRPAATGSGAGATTGRWSGRSASPGQRIRSRRGSPCVKPGSVGSLTENVPPTETTGTPTENPESDTCSVPGHARRALHVAAAADEQRPDAGHVGAAQREVKRRRAVKHGLGLLQQRRRVDRGRAAAAEHQQRCRRGDGDAAPGGDDVPSEQRRCRGRV